MTRGSIRVAFEGESYFLKASVPHEVRDADLRLVDQAVGHHTYNVEPGLYQVDAITLDGARSSQLVEVEEDDTADVVFVTETRASPHQAGRPRTVDEPFPEPPYPRKSAQPGGVQRSAEAYDPWVHRYRDIPEDDAVHDRAPTGAPQPEKAVLLVRTLDCGVVNETPSSWVFAPSSPLEQTPRAIFEAPGMVIEISLPLHDRAEYPLNAARVTVEKLSSGDYRFDTTFTPERRVVSVLDRMLGTGAMVEAESLFQEASSLLFAKYSDPPAAALGGLTMQRLGKLDERQGWVRNLASGFEWLPDGRILMASLLRDDPNAASRAEGLEMLLEASRRRPMFTDGLSLLMELLRRWPDEDSEAQRLERVEELAGQMVSADLDATCLTIMFPTGG